MIITVNVDQSSLEEKIKERTVELRKERDQALATLSSIGEGLFVVDKQYVVTLANSAALRFVGMQEAAIIGKDIRDGVSLFHRERAMPHEGHPVTLAIEQGKTSIFGPEADFYYKKSGGTRFPVAISVAPVMNRGTGTGAVVVFRDATEEKRIEESQSNFIAIASHQLRTPLTSMRWFLEMLLGGDAGTITEQQKHFVERVYKGTERMVTLVGLLLQIARAEAGKIDIDPAYGDLREGTENIVRNFAPILSGRSQHVRIQSEPDPFPKVSFDQEIYAVVLGNLLRNALWYSPEASEIVVTLSKKAKGVVCAVHDSGAGIPEADQSRIFEKFFRAQNAIGMAPDGWGLDLFLSKYITEAWGGTCWFTSNEGKGSTFFFSIPSDGMKKIEGWTDHVV